MGSKQHRRDPGPGADWVAMLPQEWPPGPGQKAGPQPAWRLPCWLRAYIRAYLRSVRWLLDPSNREQATNIMQTKARLDPEAAVRIYEGAIERLLPDAELTVAGIRSVVDVMVLAGLIEPGAHPPQKYVDLTFLTSVRNRLEN